MFHSHIEGNILGTQECKPNLQKLYVQSSAEKVETEANSGTWRGRQMVHVFRQVSFRPLVLQALLRPAHRPRKQTEECKQQL